MNPIKFGEASSGGNPEPSLILLGRCRDLMVGIRHLRIKRKSRLQTTYVGSESCSGMHNLEVVGSNPTPATKLVLVTKRDLTWFVRYKSNELR